MEFSDIIKIIIIILVVILLFGALFISAINASYIQEVKILSLRIGTNDFLVNTETLDEPKNKQIYHTNKQNFDRLEENKTFVIKCESIRIVDVYIKK